MVRKTLAKTAVLMGDRHASANDNKVGAAKARIWTIARRSLVEFSEWEGPGEEGVSEMNILRI